MNQAPTKAKKVLFVITKSNWGGAQKYVYDLATSLPRDKFDVAVAFGGTGKRGEPAGELAFKLQDAGVQTMFIHSFARNIGIVSDLRALFELVRVFRREHPDVVHLNSSKAGALGAFAAKLVGIKKIVYTVHGLPEDEPRPAFARSVIRFGTRLTFKLCTDVVAVSKDNFERIKRPNVHLIYNGTYPTELLSRNEARKMAVPSEIAARHENAIWVLTNAELHPNKNLFTAIDAVARHNETNTPKVFYVIMGAGELKDKLEADITHRKMREEVFLAGFVPHAARYLNAFDIFFLPSKKEGLPYVVLEAGLAQLPVIASAVGGTPEIIENGTSGFLFRPDDVAGFSGALTKLAKDTQLRQAVGEALQWRIKRDFSFEKMLQQTIALY